TYQDLVDYRATAAKVIRRLGHQPILMEDFGAMPDAATDVCRQEIDGAELFVGIYAHRYGHIPPDMGQSITQMEYRYAEERDLPKFCFIIDERYPWIPEYIDSGRLGEHLRQFKNSVNTSVVRDSFTTPDDLGLKIGTSIAKFLLT